MYNKGDAAFCCASGAYRLWLTLKRSAARLYDRGAAVQCAAPEGDEALYMGREKSGLIAPKLGSQFPDELNEDRSSQNVIADFARAVKDKK